jgi:hypothetical protein
MTGPPEATTDRRGCGPARISSVRAFSFPGHLVVIAEGEVPTPCHRVVIEQRFFEPEPPAPPLNYAVEQCLDPRVRCVAAVTPYKESEIFDVTEAPETISVAHAGGIDQIHVEPLPEPPVGADGDGTAVGRSRSLSFQEAFADAVRQLPMPNFPDALLGVEVVEIGGEFGGIAGLHHLYVKVRAR